MALNENPTLTEIVNEVERLNELIIDRGGSRTITPITKNQVLSKGNYKGDITVKGDSNLIPSNILSGKTIFGVTGSAKQATGNATASQVLSGYTFSNSTSMGITGTMANRGGSKTITPTTSNQTLSSGYYSGNITVKGDSNLVSSNIVSGKSIFGVSGSATVSSLGGKKWATGKASASSAVKNFTHPNGTQYSSYFVTISNLSFTPSLILVEYVSGDNIHTATFIDDKNSLFKSSVRSAFFWYPNETSGSNRFFLIDKNVVTNNTYALPMSRLTTNANWLAIE